ncbi:MAG TPA: hypothetical protein VFT87_03190 [Candidatus Saccharimonadales bacterium]|nr:hypothetical protein [Candidatus Saccharimonadales bacterium]
MSYEHEYRPSLPATPGSPEFFREVAHKNPIYLISADTPGSGSTTFVQGMSESVAARYDVKPHTIHVGQTIREMTGVFERDELQDRINETGNPQIFDYAIYSSLPTDRPCIVNGELATTLGPQYIDSDRPIICIDLVSQPLIAAKRVLEREGNTVADIFRGDPPRISGQLALTNTRIAQAENMRSWASSIAKVDNPRVYRFTADTSKFSAPELIERCSGNGDFSQYVPEWEYLALQDTLATLADLRAKLGDKVHRIDVTHFNYQYEAIQYNTERLRVVLYPEGIAEVRATLRKAIVDCWFGLTMKEIPRFFEDQDGNTVLDTESGAWTPNFYKIAEAWPALSTILKDKAILDPFGGAGTLVNLLVARDIPSLAIMSDLAYKGGVPINDAGNTYLPGLNGQAARLVFDSLPSWYRPDFSPIKGYVTADARNLPFVDNAVDYIVGDPPYGRRHPTGGIDLLMSVLDECGRVSREGSIFLVPFEWPEQIERAGYKVERLTNEVSRGLSKHPVCYIKVTSPEQDVTNKSIYNSS